ncbi:MAG: hypothetical protein L6Q84_26385 [Polyangiaceae bacterium]|nr:hypothetical protein [Polyangiaceae bacterium]
MSMKAFEGMGPEDPRKWQLATQFAQAIGTQCLQGHQLVQNQSDGELELRGKWHGYPARMKLDMNFGSIEWEMKAANPTGASLFLHWNPEAVPNVGQFSGDVASDWGEDDSTKYFFGKGFYLGAEKAELDRLLAVYQSLHEHVRGALVTHMIGDKIARLYLYGHGSICLGFDANVYEFPDPVNQTARGVWLMGQVAWGLGQIDPGSLPAPEQAAPSGMLFKMTCGYCRTLYLWSQNQFCPNCGAPPQQR